jgi:hypothetical protein
MSLILNGTSGITFNDSSVQSAAAVGAKAWINFDGETASPTIRASFNVSSITDNGGLGNYTVNFTTAMSDANYCVVAAGQGYTAVPTVALQGPGIYTLAAGSFSVSCGSNTNTADDWPVVCLAVFR